MKGKNEISDQLREATQRFLSKQNIRSIAAKTGYSYSYIKAVQLQIRFNETIENELIIAIKNELDLLTKLCKDLPAPDPKLEINI